MVIMGQRARSLETSTDPKLHQVNEDGQTQNQKICGYEKFREERIKENLERMKKLGILDLSLKLKNTPKPLNPKNNNNSPSIRKPPQRLSPLPPSGSIRRSSRLGNVTPVSYSEVHLSKKGSFETEAELLREGSKPEIYTEEHEKLLGDTNMSWTLFVDGYGKDGKRIYDPIRGKTCHQCRQKTLGHRTQCSQCNKVQGQFCGDCLYMRYGENVLEAEQNPDWVCPVCRGICNCSLCRQAKGWPPTGVMYKKISNLGFKSVAHYLVQTQRSAIDLEKDSGLKVPVSAKRSLPFSSMEATPLLKESADSINDLEESLEQEFEDSNKMNEYHKGEEEDMMHISDKEHGVGNFTPESSADDQGSSVPESEDNKTDGEFEGKKEEMMQLLNDEDGESNVRAKTSPESVKVPSTDKEPKDDEGYVAPESSPCPTKVPELIIKSIDDHQGLPKPEDNKTDDVLFTSKEESVQFLDNKHCDSSFASKNVAGSKRKTFTCTEPDSIGARLRQRRRGGSYMIK